MVQGPSSSPRERTPPKRHRVVRANLVAHTCIDGMIDREETDPNLRLRDTESDLELPPGWGALRMLEPDSGMDALDEEAHAWLRERADECTAALGPFAHEVELPSLAVRTVRTMAEAVRAWRAGEQRFERWNPYARTRDPSFRELWDQLVYGDARGPEASPTGAWLEALGRAVTELDAFGARLRETWVLMHAAARHVAERSPLAVFAHPSSWDEGFAWQSSLACDALWRARFGTRPSPWSAWLRVWERGAWPVLGPGPTMVVYVPVRTAGRIAHEPLFSRRERSSLTGGAALASGEAFMAPGEVFAQPHPLGLPFPPASVPVRARPNTSNIVGPLPPPECADAA